MAQIINNQFPTLATDEQEVAPYLVYNIKTRYIWNPGVTSMPSGAQGDTDPRPPAEVIRLHSPIGWKVVTFTAVRRIKQPEVPSPEPADPSNETLIWADFSTESPALDGDLSNHVYAVSGVYVYALSRPVFPTDQPGIPSGKVVYDQTPADMNRFLPSNFRTDLLGTPPPE